MAPDDTHDDRRRFELDLPFYANGSLPAEEQAWMAQYLAAHPEARQALQLVERIRDASRQTASARPESERLARLLAAWRADRPASPGLLARFLAWLTAPHAVPGAWMVAGVLLVLAQSLFLLHPPAIEDAPQYRDVAPSGPAPCARLRVAFSPGAPLAEVVMVLRKAEATVVGGPSETGEWWLNIPRSRTLEEASAILRASPLVDELTMLEPAPQARCAQ